MRRGLWLLAAAVLAACDEGAAFTVATPPPPGASARPSPTPSIDPQALSPVISASSLFQPVALPPSPTPLAFPSTGVSMVSAPSPTPVPTPYVLVTPPQVSDPALGSVTFTHFTPQAAGATLSTSDDENYALAPLGTPKQRLFLLLGASRQKPGDYQQLLRVAASQGCHVLGLVYASDTAASALCGTNLDCYGTVRGAMFGDGSAQPPLALDAVDGVTNRLSQALAYLVTTYPDQGWSAYQGPGGTPDWAKITVAGHSLGAGEAAYIASRVAVPRVVLFSGPVDGDGAHAATWITAAGATSVSNVYALASTQDPVYRDGHIPAAWTAGGLDALGRFSVDNEVDFGTAHELLTSGVSNDPHGSTAMDGSIVLTSGSLPRMEGAWRYMIGP